MSVTAPEAKGNMGQPKPRLDARAKVTGGAKYASDFPLPNPAFAYLVISAISKGRITAFNLKKAKAVRGVIDIFTHENTPNIKTVNFSVNPNYQYPKDGSPPSIQGYPEATRESTGKSGRKPRWRRHSP